MELKIIEYLISVLITISIGYFTSRVINIKRERNTYRDIVYLILCSFVATAIFVLFYYIKSNNSRQSKLEGNYIERFEDEYVDDSLGNKLVKPKIRCFFALADIKFDEWTNQIKYEGVSYDTTGEILGFWNSNISVFENKELIYTFRGASYGNNKGSREGFGKIVFDGESGKGEFISPLTDSAYRSFYIKKLHGSDSVTFIDKPDSLIRVFYNNPEYFKKLHVRKRCKIK